MKIITKDTIWNRDVDCWRIDTVDGIPMVCDAIPTKVLYHTVTTSEKYTKEQIENLTCSLTCDEHLSSLVDQNGDVGWTRIVPIDPIKSIVLRILRWATQEEYVTKLYAEIHDYLQKTKYKELREDFDSNPAKFLQWHLPEDIYKLYMAKWDSLALLSKILKARRTLKIKKEETE